MLEAGILTTLTALEHLVEAGQHVLHALHVLRRHALDALGHLVDDLLHHLLAEPFHQLLEALPGLARLEVVGAQLAHLAGQVVGHQVELHLPVGGGVAGSLRPAFVTARLGVAEGVVDGVALLVDDVVELAVDLVVHPAEVVPVEPLLTLLA